MSLRFMCVAMACGILSACISASSQEKSSPLAPVPDSLWTISGEQLDQARRAWNAIQPLEPDATISEFKVTYDVGPKGEAIIAFFHPSTTIYNEKENLVSPQRNHRGYQVVIEGPRITVIANEE